MSAVFLTRFPETAAHCINCPTGGGSSVGEIVIGIVLALVGVGVMVLSQRRDRKERQASTEPRAASIPVTISRAVATLLIVLGLVTAAFRP